MGVVVVTRDETAEGPLSTRLQQSGLTVLSWPVLQVRPLQDSSPLMAALQRATEFDWIVFTSQHAVDAVTEHLPERPAGVRVGAVGESTADALVARGWGVDLVPQETGAAALANALMSRARGGARVLFPASSRALPTLADALRARDFEVHQVTAYQVEPAAADVHTWRTRIEDQAVDAVTFTSPSAVEELEQALGPQHFEQLLSRACAVALGSTTGRALAARGHACVLAEPTTLDGLAATTSRLLSLRS